MREGVLGVQRVGEIAKVTFSSSTTRVVKGRLGLMTRQPFCSSADAGVAGSYSKLPVTPWNPWRACLTSHFITRATS